jgi:hypothetical protein
MLKSKISSLLLGIALLFFTVSGCEKKLVDSFPPIYVLNLMFTDQEGRDLLSDVRKDIITNDIKISSSDGEILTSSVEVLEFNNKKYLKIELSSRPNVNLKQITYSISNKDLMGDPGVHKIITQLHLEKNNNIITTLQLDGKSLTRSDEPFIHYKLVKSE